MFLLPPVWKRGAVTLWLVVVSSRSSGVGWSLAGDIVLCSWARHFTLSFSLLLGVQMGTGNYNLRGKL